MTEHYFISASNQPRLSHKQCLLQRRLSAFRCLQQSPTTEHATTIACYTTKGRRHPSATIESSTVLQSQEIVDEDTSRVTYAAPRDSVEQGANILPEEDIAKSVVSVAIFPEHTSFITKIRTDLLETDDDNAINLDLNADTIFPDRVHLKRWKDPDKEDARHIRVKEELESVKCYSIELSGKLCGAVTQPTSDVPPSSVMTSPGRSRQRSR